MAVLQGPIIPKGGIYSLFLASETWGHILLKLHCAQEDTIIRYE